jgi:hypothetical protein
MDESAHLRGLLTHLNTLGGRAGHRSSRPNYPDYDYPDYDAPRHPNYDALRTPNYPDMSSPHV